jgi:predicted Zn-dependent peptidase
MFYTWLACEPDLVEQNLSLLDGIVRQIESTGVSDAELQQAKNKVKARVVLSSERPQSRLFNVGGNWLQRREYRTVADDLKALDEVTIGDLERVLRNFPLSQYTTLTVGPREDVRPPKG